jgi:hypothetical protein
VISRAMWRVSPSHCWAAPSAPARAPASATPSSGTPSAGRGAQLGRQLDDRHLLDQPGDGAGGRNAIAISRREVPAIQQRDDLRTPVALCAQRQWEHQRGEQREVGTTVGGKQRERRLEHRLLIAQPRVQRVQHPQLVDRRQRSDRIRFAERQPQLGADPRAGDGIQRSRNDRRLGQPGGTLLDLKSEPRSVARHPQQTGRIVGEALLMQYSQPALFEVPQRIGHSARLPPTFTAQADGDRVDGEVPARQVLLLGSRAYVRQSPRYGVGLGAPGRDVDPAAIPFHERRAKTFVLVRARENPEAGAEITSEQRGGLRDGPPIAAYHNVQLARGSAQQQIAHRAPDKLQIAPLPGHRKQRLTAW